MTAENLIREALHDGLRLRSPARVEKYQRAEGALNALVASHAAGLEVVEAARQSGTGAIDVGQAQRQVEHLAAVLRKYDAVVAALPKVSNTKGAENGK